MNNKDEELDVLREALAVSPDNLPLQRRLGELLLEQKAFEEAEAAFKNALGLTANDARSLRGLAMAYHRQGKNSAALVVMDELLAAREHAGDLLLHARILLSSGQAQAAVAAFELARELDSTAHDQELADKLGIDADPACADVVDGRVRAPAGSDVLLNDVEAIEKPALDFSQVGGMDSVKEEIRMKIIFPLTNKDLYKAYGKAIGGGILMYGPPGCGKTYLARATAGEIKAGFISVGLHDVLDMWLGQSEQKLHQLFQQARKSAPCVLFFDEVDALAASRSDMRHSAGRHIINQFLSELDGVETSNEGVLILAATNAPWHVDSAFRRPGRFDRILFVPPPDDQARQAILELLLRDKPHDKIDYSQLVKKTRQFSGADIKALVDKAIEEALALAMKKGQPIPLNTKMLCQASAKIRPSASEWFGTARNHALYANESGLYNDVLDYLNVR